MEPYIPEELPLKNLDLTTLFPLIGPASIALARYDGLLRGLVNPEVMLSPLTAQEAVLSSRIEGTQATVDEVLLFEAGETFNQHKNEDIAEVLNYRKALLLASEELVNRPISLSLVKQTHAILMDSVRGADKCPGEFRREQNWIGSVGSKIEEATFVPPSPILLSSGLDVWEKYIGENDIDTILQAAVVHAQFELLHPFKDGNGRIGRLLIPLFLYQKKLLGRPSFYLSEYLETNRDLYYARLQGISKHGDWTSWVAFFLEGVRLQADKNTERLIAIHQLYDVMKARISEATRSQYAISILDELFRHPIFQSGDFVKRTGIPKQTAAPILKILREHGILKVLKDASGRRAAVLAFGDLLNLSEGKKIF